MALIRLDEPTVRPKTPPKGFALFALGFRPFYLLAALFATLAVPLWLAQFHGLLPAPPWMPGLFWHAHEMVFGFAVAVIVGFLLTAAQNWTSLPTAKGAPLAALAAVWLLGRIGIYAAPPLLAAVLDLAFLPLAAVSLGRVLWRAKSQRNYFTVALLLALTVANGLFHASVHGLIAADPLTVMHAALALVMMLVTIIAGRIVPSFTANALKGVRQFQNDQINACAIGFTGCALALSVGGANAALTAIVALLAAALQAIRTWGWNPWATRKTPLLWVLHLGHLWLPVGLTLLAVAALGWIPQSPAWHAFGFGAMSALILGMITRTALGHTGRLLLAGRSETAAYALLHGGALIRVIGPLVLPGAMSAVLGLAMLCWSGAFALYLIRYAPILINPRVDGRPG
ncbi:NnrS family protein [Niveibacterium microcysteis]|uniref:NnrS family protein n=1 Tax=Niveibacterium microcysteis TaxID=2811415 RepID=A0ABX7M7T1_9RHOO|nr:NnrS family protein [Niveibacterium microcysteis]QSI77811.1 NnrS family protein [Niveibacterium microcysteis]